MKGAAFRILLFFAVAVAASVAMKAVFMALNFSTYASAGVAGALSAMAHGLAMDCTVAGYLTAPIALLAVAMQLTGAGWLRSASLVWAWIAALIIAATGMVDAVLYGYWGFKLDMTPIFYLVSSPSAAMASMQWWQPIVGITAITLITWSVAIIFKSVALRWGIAPAASVSVRFRRASLTLLLAAALIIPIRGGVTVSTMNLSRAYFSSDTRLNHAAVNPAFSLLYSATHWSGNDNRFNFYASADSALNIMRSLPPATPGDSLPARLLNTSRPDICIVLLESFSAKLLPILGGEPVALSLDSIARGGLTFTRHFASGFRTDRAIPAVLSGYPSLPTLSVMKHSSRCERIPSLTSALAANGYQTAYYYGGDINFTNMLSYLRSSGFGKVVADTDFPLSERMSKWGVLDHVLLARAASELTSIAPGDTVPRLTVVQTSSSHEPFEVPYHNPRLAHDKAANAFGYTDRSVGEFVNALSRSPRWDRTLVILVADHYGAYPRDLTDPVERHHVPLVMTGGALAARGMVSRPLSQTDIAATLLGQMGISHSLPFSRDITDSRNAPWAFFSSPERAVAVTANDTAVYDINAARFATPGRYPITGEALKAWLQLMYTDFQSR